ncbi:hypothetical protein ACFW3D_40720 [Streptomyces sp. NPDC058864]
MQQLPWGVDHVEGLVRELDPPQHRVAIDRPADVDVNELVVRPTAQG